MKKRLAKMILFVNFLEKYTRKIIQLNIIKGREKEGEVILIILGKG
jgi:hypothetical protein